VPSWEQLRVEQPIAALISARVVALPSRILRGEHCFEAS
jgi:hypothetical protein